MQDFWVLKLTKNKRLVPDLIIGSYLSVDRDDQNAPHHLAYSEGLERPGTLVF